MALQLQLALAEQGCAPEGTEDGIAAPAALELQQIPGKPSLGVSRG